MGTVWMQVKKGTCAKLKKQIIPKNEYIRMVLQEISEPFYLSKEI